MKTEVEKLEGNKVRLKVEVPAQVLDGAVKKTYKDLSARLFVPGFRKGKVPKPVIDAQVGKDAVVARAAETIITSRYPEALVSSGVDPVEQPEVRVVKAEPGESLIFEADVEVKPEAKLGKYKGVEIVIPSVKATDEDVDGQVDLLRQRFARLEVVKDRPVAEGDYVLLDFTGTIDGGAFDGSSATDYMVEVGSGQLLEELEKGLVGVAKGDNPELKVTIPEDFHNSKIAGKQAEFKINVKEIKQKVLPEANDEFVSESTEHDTIAGLRDDLRNKFEVVKLAQARMVGQTKLLDKLIEEAEVDVPEKLLDMELDQMVAELEQNLERQGSNIEQYLEVTKSTMDKVREEYEQEAKKRIQRELVIIAVAKAENIEVSREEIDDEVREIAKALGKPVAEVQGSIARKGTLPELHASLVRRKTIDWLLDNSKAKTEDGEEIELRPPEPAEKVKAEAQEARAQSADIVEKAAGSDSDDLSGGIDTAEAAAAVEEESVAAAGVEKPPSPAADVAKGEDDTNG